MVSALALSGDIVAYVVCICFFLLPLRFRFVCIFFRLLLIDGDDDDVFGIARKLAILSKHTLYAHCGFGNVVCRMWIFQCTGVGVFRIRCSSTSVSVFSIKLPIFIRSLHEHQYNLCWYVQYTLMLSRVFRNSSHFVSQWNDFENCHPL